MSRPTDELRRPVPPRCDYQVRATGPATDPVRKSSITTEVGILAFERGCKNIDGAVTDGIGEGIE